MRRIATVAVWAVLAVMVGPITGCDTDDTRSPSTPPAAPSPPPPAPQTPPKAVRAEVTLAGSSSHVFQ